MTDGPDNAKLLKSIQASLDELKSIFILANKDKIGVMKRKLLPKGSVKERIYSLCDGTKTTVNIAQAIGKRVPYVNSYLSILRREGLVRTAERQGKLVHEQII